MGSELLTSPTLKAKESFVDVSICIEFRKKMPSVYKFVNDESRLLDERIQKANYYLNLLSDIKKSSKVPTSLEYYEEAYAKLNYIYLLLLKEEHRF